MPRFNPQGLSSGCRRALRRAVGLAVPSGPMRLSSERRPGIADRPGTVAGTGVGAFEPLEARRLMAVSASLTRGLLDVAGTPLADNTVVSRGGGRLLCSVSDA